MRLNNEIQINPKNWRLVNPASQRAGSNWCAVRLYIYVDGKLISDYLGLEKSDFNADYVEVWTRRENRKNLFRIDSATPRYNNPVTKFAIKYDMDQSHESVYVDELPQVISEFIGELREYFNIPDDISVKVTDMGFMYVRTNC